MKKVITTCTLLMFFSSAMFAHTINYTLDKMSSSEVFGNYLLEGFKHILPLGLDHILFILCVFFLNTSIRQIIMQATMFTVAHTITLGLAMYGVITPPGNIVEPIIALSILFLAMENIFSTKVKPWRLVMVFLFGLVHGMGFAGALSDLGMPEYAFATALLSFNIGVELGQLAIILLMYFLVSRPFARNQWYRGKVVVPVSLMIGLVAGYWTIERIFFAS
ncbi:MAG: HupE/UreJ family protein [Chitinophagales bacterium]